MWADKGKACMKTTTVYSEMAPPPLRASYEAATAVDPLRALSPQATSELDVLGCQVDSPGQFHAFGFRLQNSETQTHA